ncbi:MAG: hypothetical protein PHT99_02415 [Methanoregula sp.]|nr:hypothetical protein [Methanoregula sp.]
MTSLEQLGIPLNCNPPKGEPGRSYVLIGGHDYNDPRSAVDIALQHRKTHPDTPVEIWPVSGDTWRVVREVVN